MLTERIRQELSNLLLGRINLDQFEDWFIPVTWDLPEDEPAKDVAAEITLLLVEFMDADWTLPELLSQLAEVKDRLPVPTQA